jgi:predicted PurR-regulated permease PerM
VSERDDENEKPPAEPAGLVVSSNPPPRLPESLPPADASWTKRVSSLIPGGGPGSPRRRLIFFGISAAALLLILWISRDILLLFILALVVAYVLAPIVSFLERWMKRWIAVVVLYVALLAVLTVFVWLGVPRLVVEVEKLAGAVPSAVTTARDQWLPEIEKRFRDAMAPYATPEDPLATDPQPEDPGIVVNPTPEGGYSIDFPEGGVVVRPERDGSFRVDTSHPPPPRRDLTTAIREAVRRQMENTEEYAVSALKTAQQFIAALVRGVFGFFIMLMLSAYMLATSDKIFAFFKSLARPSRRDQFDNLLKRIDRGLSGVVRGQLIIALVNGVLSGIGFYLFDLPYWPILTLIATVLSVIPIFGAILSSIPAVAFALQEGIGTALGTLAWIIGIHQIEANLLNPKIMGDAAKVHPVLVVFALIAGEHLYGIAGALLAVPVLSILQSLFLHYREVALGVPAPKRDSLAPPEPVAKPVDAPPE